MAFGKKQILAAFLEKDNVKLLAYEVAGKNVSRIFAGQVSFGDDALRDAFISDSLKFSSQVKMVLSQKPPLSEIAEGLLFVHPDKTFIKALPKAESLDSFVRSLPFFKEELVIQEPVQSDKDQVNYVAFEKKLVEDFERPFLESGKKILAVNSAVTLLAKKFAQAGRYLLVMPFEKEVTVAACADGVVLDLVTLPKDVWVGRLGEFRMGKGFSDITTLYSIGSLEVGVSDKFKAEQQLTVSELTGGDVYDIIVGAYFSGSPNAGSGFSWPKIPGQKYIFLILAAIVGFLLVFLVLKNLLNGKIQLPAAPVNNKKATATKTPVPTVAPKPADFKVIVLNGTTVPGEAGAFGEILTGMGFNVLDTKNATESGFVATRLLTTMEVPESITDQIKTKLLERYESVNLENLASSSAQIEVIIGKKKS